jgi:hypothetical protein
MAVQPVTRCYTDYTVAARVRDICEPKYWEQGKQRELESSFQAHYTSEYLIVLGIIKLN